jgi:mxaK protein
MLLSMFKPILPWRGPILWMLALLALLFTASTVLQVLRIRSANDAIASLAANKDVSIDPKTSPSEVILARVNQLIFHDRIDDAHTVLSSREASIDPHVRARALYNIANERTRRAAEFVRKGDLDHAAALVNVAKSEYRLALKLDPSDWNTKFNLDIAMRIVRDLPQAENLPDDEQATPKKVWTDLPGVPKGLP